MPHGLSFGIRATSVGAHHTDGVKLIGEFDVPNQAPVLTVDNTSVSLPEDGAVGNIPGAHANATDSDGDPIAFSLVSPDDGSGHALFAIDSAGQISLTAEARRSSITRRRRATR